MVFKNTPFVLRSIGIVALSAIGTVCADQIIDRAAQIGSAAFQATRARLRSPAPQTLTPRSGKLGHSQLHVADSKTAISDTDAQTDVADTPRSVVEARLTPAQIQLRDRVQSCVRFYAERPLNSRDDSVWSIMHGFLAHGSDTEIRLDGPQGKPVNAIGWICWNGLCNRVRLFYTHNGQLGARVGPGLQGHPGQFLAMLAQCGVRSDYEIRVDEQRFTIDDLIEIEKQTCRPQSELTFKLMALSHYLPSHATWHDLRKRQWSIPALIEQELAQPINGVTCGGTHRLMGLSFAVQKRRQRGEPVDGAWQKAESFVRDYQRLAFQLQNQDGSFSTKFFRGRGQQIDRNRRLLTTGHILEWLVYSLPEDELLSKPVLHSVQYLTDLLINERYYRWEIGPRCHAIRALKLYDRRALRGQPEAPHLAASGKPPAPRQRLTE